MLSNTQGCEENVIFFNHKYKQRGVFIFHHLFDEHLLEYAVGRVILHPRNLDKCTQMYKNVHRCTKIYQKMYKKSPHCV